MCTCIDDARVGRAGSCKDTPSCARSLSAVTIEVWKMAEIENIKNGKREKKVLENIKRKINRKTENRNRKWKRKTENGSAKWKMEAGNGKKNDGTYRPPYIHYIS